MKISRASLIMFLLSTWVKGIPSEVPGLVSPEDTQKCDIECPSTRTRPVCGTDGRTYSSKCEINKAKCEGHPVEFKHRGKCPERIRCRAHRVTAQLQILKQGTETFVPECKEDGSYVDVQCHSSSGYCWCMDKSGKPISGSAVLGKKPNCDQQVCSNADRTAFNRNLIDIIKSEYRRIPRVTTPASENPNGELLDAEEKQAILWKFDELDKNMDNYLKRKELRDLRRMTKKIVKPRSCAKTFTKYCDLDQDKKISRNEWTVCLGVDLNKEEQVPPTDEAEDDLSTGLRTALWDKIPRLKNDGGNKPNTDNKDEDANDCLGARQIAMEDHKRDPKGRIYIPRCTPEGNYERVQCHGNGEYCWCVIPKTGKPMKGSATYGEEPDCKKIRENARTFKGCSLQKKQVFLDELAESFTEQMVEIERNSTQSTVLAPSQEQAAKWKYSVLDADKNQSLEKNEWTAFRQEWKAFLKGSKRRKKLRKLRKCWRNFPRFCDVNNNNKITEEEWLTCTGVTREAKGTLPLNHRRRGQNPFSTILKGE